MTPQEAENLAARLQRIWTPLFEVEERELTIDWELGESPRFSWKCTDHHGAQVSIFTIDGRPFVFLRQGNFELHWCDQTIGSNYRDFTEHQNKVLVARWSPVFRRNFWLSGYKIEASVFEQEEWLRDFTDEEIELWNLDCHIKNQMAVDEKIEREAIRVAAAFGVKVWDRIEEDFDGKTFSTMQDSTHFVCSFDSNGEIESFSLFANEKGAHEYAYSLRRIDNGGWWESAGGRSPYKAQMARGLYRLGFEDEEVFAQLPPLTAHERLEARLSLPREFWPQKWLDEEATR